MSLAIKFAQDPQGRRFADVMSDTRINFNAVLDFFEDPTRQRRMIESELHHGRPALAGIIKELEAQPDVEVFLKNHDAHTTIRFRQAVGVIVKIIMKSHGWKTTGRKGSLGTRAKVPTRTATPGAYRNDSGLAVWFTRAERYEQ
jgi:hypothetical protein